MVGGGHEVIHVLAVDDAWHVIENHDFDVDAALGKPITPLEFSAEIANLSDLQQIAIILNQAAGLRVRAAGERKRNQS